MCNFFFFCYVNEMYKEIFFLPSNLLLGLLYIGNVNKYTNSFWDQIIQQIIVKFISKSILNLWIS